MNRLRSIEFGLVAIAAAIVSGIAGLATAAPAFAMRQLPPGDSSNTSVVAVHHAGIAGWQIALIVVAVVVVGALALVARRSRSRVATRYAR
jgi:hypothetical protein